MSEGSGRRKAGHSVGLWALEVWCVAERKRGHGDHRRQDNWTELRSESSESVWQSGDQGSKHCLARTFLRTVELTVVLCLL